MFDSLYPEAADAAITAKANRAPEPVPPTPWFRGGWSAVGKALPRAGAEMARALTTPLTPEAAAALSSPSMFSAPSTAPSQATSELRQQDSAIRDAIKEMTPDANSTGAAAMILHDVTRFVGKAAAYSVAGGAAGAVVGMGLDEGINETLRRTDEGIDPATAAKLGVVKGVSSAVAVALPVAGRTIGQTLALAAGGGPGSFIAEQITAREILENADYTKEAAEIDPFDPLGLGVSFFGSLIFGAGALGARRMRAKADGSKADGHEDQAPAEPITDAPSSEPTTAQTNIVSVEVGGKDPHTRAYEHLADGRITRTIEYPDGTKTIETLVTTRDGDETWVSNEKYGKGEYYPVQASAERAQKAIIDDTPAHARVESAARRAVTQEQVDAAHVSELQTHRETSGLHAPEDVAARAEHARALDEATTQLATGQRVSVAEVAPVDAARIEAEAIPRIERAEAAVRDVQARAVAIEQQLSFIETRGGQYRFHGTSRPIDVLSNEYALAGDSRNIYGQGFYTTDAVDISYGYMKKGKGGEPTLYSVDEMPDVRLFDMESEIAPEVQAILRDNMGDLLPERNYETDAPLKNLREVYDEYRKNSSYEGLSRDDVQEVFDGIRARLEALGYRGFRHVGGGNTGKAPHDVKVFWYPQEDVMITPADLKAFAAADDAKPAADGAKPETPDPAAQPAASADTPSADFVAREADTIAQTDPDLMVMMEGMDQPVKASELLAEAKAMAEQEIADAPLMKVAAECALRG